MRMVGYFKTLASNAADLADIGIFLSIIAVGN